MTNIDDVFAAMPDTQAITVDDSVDFVIDSNLRVISIPTRGVVLGVEGDKDVNRVTFLMPKIYKGVDMSAFQIRINYANANGEKNFFKVTETSVANDQIRFVWVVGADAVAYMGDVEFVVRFVKLNGSTVVQELNTTLATAKSLIGLSVDGEITPVQKEDLLAHFYSEIDTYSEKKKNEILGSIPSDYQVLDEKIKNVVREKGNETESTKISYAIDVNDEYEVPDIEEFNGLKEILTNIYDDQIKILNDSTFDGYAIQDNGSPSSGYNKDDWTISKMYNLKAKYILLNGMIGGTNKIYFYTTDEISNDFFISLIETPNTSLKNYKIKVPNGAKYMAINIRKTITDLTYNNFGTMCPEYLKIAGVNVSMMDYAILSNGSPDPAKGWYVSQIFKYENGMVLNGKIFNITDVHEYTGNIVFYSNRRIDSLYFEGTISFDKRTVLNNFELKKPTENSRYFVIVLRNNANNFIDVCIKDIYMHQKNAEYTSIHSISTKIANGEITKIKILGDSITHGFGGTGYTNDVEHGKLIMTHDTESWYINTDGICWANMLKTYLNEKFGCKVINFGCSGISTGHIIKHINELVEDDDDLIICMIGTNDRNSNGIDLISGKQRTPLQAFYNMQTICDLIKEKEKKVIFMSNIPASIENELDGKTGHMEDIDNQVMRLAGLNNMEYISVYKLFIRYCVDNNITIDSLLSDGLHPNDTGYSVMFYLICNALGIGTKRPDATW